jgi:hypothetical protein
MFCMVYLCQAARLVLPVPTLPSFELLFSKAFLVYLNNGGVWNVQINTSQQLEQSCK